MSVTPETKPRKPIWQFPWKYAESFIIAFGLVLVGFIIEFATNGSKVPAMSWPVNAYFGIILSQIILFTHLKLRHTPFVKWLRSTEAATASIVAFTFVAMILGVFPQGTEQTSTFLARLGMYDILSGWAYLISFLFLLITLGFVIAHRAFPFHKKNIGFLLNHFGLWLTLLSASMGAGDLQRMMMFIYEDKDFEWRAVDGDKTYDMPFALKLLDFDIVEYPPKLALADKFTGEFLGQENKNIFLVTDSLKAQIKHVKFEVIEFAQASIPDSLTYIPSDEHGSMPAALIKITNTKTNEEKLNWITCGSYKYKGQYASVDDSVALIMLQPEPKKYFSKVEVLTPDKKKQQTTIEVNLPFEVNGWKLYQVNYNEKLGRWSNLSVIEAIRDPWLPLVYFGIFLLMLGTIYIFWIGKNRK